MSCYKMKIKNSVYHKKKDIGLEMFSCVITIFWFLYHANILEKGMNQTILSPTMGK